MSNLNSRYIVAALIIISAFFVGASIFYGNLSGHVEMARADYASAGGIDGTEGKGGAVGMGAGCANSAGGPSEISSGGGGGGRPIILPELCPDGSERPYHLECMHMTTADIGDGSDKDVCITTYEDCPAPPRRGPDCDPVIVTSSNACNVGETGSGRTYQGVSNTCTPGVWTWSLLSEDCYPTPTAVPSKPWVTASCLSPSVAKLDWGGSSGATTYALRYSSGVINSVSDCLSGLSIVAPNTCGSDNIGLTSLNIPIVTGASYNVWVHGVSAGGWGTAGGAPTLTCTLPPPGGGDVCPNIPGDQADVPPGKTLDASGNCVDDGGGTPVGGDICPNIAGIQTGVPPGKVIDASGNCVDTTSGPGGSCPGVGTLCSTSPANSCGMRNYSHIQCVGGTSVCPAITTPDNSLCKAPTADLKITPSLINKGGRCTIDWSVLGVIPGVTVCNLAGFGLTDGCNEVTSPGSCTSRGSATIKTPALDLSSTYTLTCQNGVVSSLVTKSAKCTVNPQVIEPADPSVK